VSARKNLCKALLACALPLTLAACAAVPKPSVLADVDQVRGGPAAAEASRYAPDAFAKAEKLRAEADEAFKSGDTAGAQLLAERALAAYAHAMGLARIARAEATTAEAKTALSAAEAELGGLEANLARVTADADALELKVRVNRDAQPIQPSGKADPERERARLAAARSLAVEARMLCGAARLLAGSASPAPDDKAKAQLDEAEAALAKIEGELSAASIPAAPIDGATRARAGCLAALTTLRRAGSPTSRATGAGDALLAQISATGNYAPARDDRGVTVALRNVFSGGGAALTPQGEAKLVELGKIAAAHPTFPVEIVVHTDKPAGAREQDGLKARAEAAAKAVEKGGGGKVRTLPLVAGSGVPLADPAGPDKARNARVEVVFVTPETF
jgi:outer membrane protein OmpA-like peptidoglycan-associated protein